MARLFYRGFAGGLNGGFIGGFTGGFTGAIIALATSLGALPVAAQDRIAIDLDQAANTKDTGPPEKIDVLSPRPAPGSPITAQTRECDDKVDASEISGEIVVCAKAAIDTSNRFAGSHANWLKDYAERSMHNGAPTAPDVDGTGLPRGMAPMVTINGCFIPPCPAPPAMLIDVSALPLPPVGSDADRLARGLAPRGPDGAYTPAERRRLEVELGLPPKPDFTEKD